MRVVPREDTALPGALGAVIWRVPLVLAEQNAVASATNRLLKNFQAAAVPNAGTGLKNEVVTGSPIRESVLEAHHLGRKK